MTLYESARGLGGRSATRRVAPEQLHSPPSTATPLSSALFFDHGLPGIQVPQNNPRFLALLRSWEKQGYVERWQGPFQRLDAASGACAALGAADAWLASVPQANSLAAALANHAGIEQRLMTRVVRMQIAADQGSWRLGVRRADGPPGVLTEEGPFDALVVTDKQAVSQFSVRQYNEPPLMDDPALPPGTRALAEAMKSVGQAPRFTLMVAFRPTAPLPLLGRLQVEGSAVIETITNEMSKPRRASADGLTCLVVHSTEAYATERIGGQLTVKGSGQHANLLEDVAEEMLSDLYALVPALRAQALVYRVAHRWGACFPSHPARLPSLVARGERFAVCGDWVDMAMGGDAGAQPAENAIQSAMDAVEQLVAELGGNGHGVGPGRSDSGIASSRL